MKWNDVICSYNDEFEFQLLLLEATLEYIGTYPSRFRQVFECDVGTRLADFLHFCAFFGSKSLDAAELELLVESTQGYLSDITSLSLSHSFFLSLSLSYVQQMGRIFNILDKVYVQIFDDVCFDS